MTEDGLDLYADLDTFSPDTAARSDSSDDCFYNSAQTETPSDLWMDGNGILVHPNGRFAAYTSNAAEANQQKATPCVVSSFLERERIKAEMDIYFALFSDEIINIKSKFEMVPEFQELRSEVTRLQNLNSEKDALISELTTQNISLKKNICSLYKTAKAEDAQKDLLLAELNSKLDKFHYRKNLISHYGKDQYSQTEDQGGKYNAEARASLGKSEEDDSNKNGNRPMRDRNISTGHKRLLSPHKDFNAEHHSNAKQSKMEKCDYNAQKASTLSNSKVRTVETVPEPSRELKSSSDTAETNRLFFDLLPDALKLSFLQYEKSQIESLNRLKLSFVKHDCLQSKKQMLDMNGVHSSLEPDSNPPDSLISKACNAGMSDSSSKPLPQQASDLNVLEKSTKESISSTKHDDRLHNGNSRKERTENSLSTTQKKSSSNDKTRESHNSRSNFRTENFPNINPDALRSLYGQRQARLYFLSEIGLNGKKKKEK